MSGGGRQATRAGAAGRPSRLLVVGDTPYARVDGRLQTFAALSKQLEPWLADFDEVQIAAHLIDGPAPAGYAELARPDVELVELPAGGGPGIRAKLGVALLTLRWLVALAPRIRQAEVVHLRAPCNVTLVAIPLSRLLCRGRYAIYADNWEPLGVEPRSYRVQRWMLARFGGCVHAYVPAGADVPAHVRPAISPSFSTAELDALRPALDARLARIHADDPGPIRACCVGSFSDRKNQRGLIEAVALLVDEGVDVDLRLAGTGRTLDADRALVERRGLGDHVSFLGQLDHDAVMDLFTWADVSALVSRAEGFGKVLLESMAVGCPVVCGTGRMQATMIGDGVRGRQADPDDPRSIADALVALARSDPAERAATARACVARSREWTTEAFADEVAQVLALLRADPGGQVPG